MKVKTLLFLVILLAAMVIAACSGSATAPDVIADLPTAEAMTKKSTEEVMMEDITPQAMSGESSVDDMIHQPTPEGMMDKSTPDAMMDKSAPDAMVGDIMEMPGWFSAPLTDVRSGEQFTIGDLKGKVVLVETMAMWCSNCLRQQKQVIELHNLLGERDDFVSLGLDIDPNEEGQALQTFTEQNGFFWRYAISPTQVSREIGQLYGDQFLNPPSTPMLIIDRHGQAHPLPFGIKDAQSLMEALEPFLEESM